VRPGPRHLDDLAVAGARGVPEIDVDRLVADVHTDPRDEAIAGWILGLAQRDRLDLLGCAQLDDESLPCRIVLASDPPRGREITVERRGRTLIGRIDRSLAVRRRRDAGLHRAPLLDH